MFRIVVLQFLQVVLNALGVLIVILGALRILSILGPIIYYHRHDKGPIWIDKRSVASLVLSTIFMLGLSALLFLFSTLLGASVKKMSVNDQNPKS